MRCSLRITKKKSGKSCLYGTSRHTSDRLLSGSRMHYIADSLSKAMRNIGHHHALSRNTNLTYEYIST